MKSIIWFVKWISQDNTKRNRQVGVVKRREERSWGKRERDRNRCAREKTELGKLKQDKNYLIFVVNNHFLVLITLLFKVNLSIVSILGNNFHERNLIGII